MGKIGITKSCRNCGILRELLKIGRSCNSKEEYNLNCCGQWINGKCRNKLNYIAKG